MIDGLTVRVAAKHDEAADICSFELVHVEGLSLPPFSAGSHIDLIVPGGPTRQYSLCNAPDEHHRYRIAVLRDPKSRGGSAGMHDRVNAGDTLTISAPRNHFALAHDSTHSLLLAGGIGVTPILCMAERLARIDASFDMHYCTRSRTRTAFLDHMHPMPAACSFISTTKAKTSASISQHGSRLPRPARTCTYAARRASWTPC